ncbi:MAG: hypothetical protein LJE74_00625 [Proteobacteria bacterium]|jgi:chaperonin cofactor prefoldin|nr:hypothetical protein [Pseudomonadota bacterium]
MATKKLNEVFDELKQQRDSLRLQIHLASAEAKDKWEELETRWDEIKPKLDQASRDAGKTGSEILDALELAGGAIKQGYQRIKRDLD